MKIVTTEEMRALERRAEAAGISIDTLMENAGLAVAQAATRALNGLAGKRVVVLVGPGNNGGDGLVAARHLHTWGAQVLAYACVSGKALPAKLVGAQDAGVAVADVGDDIDLVQLRAALGAADLVIDAVLGTGQVRTIEEPLASLLAEVRRARTERPGLLVLALDAPTGLDADTGALDAAALAADLTVTLGNPKRGLFLFPGAAAVGRLEVVDIGIPGHLSSDLPLELITPTWVAATLPRRPLEAHKGSFGRALVVAGSRSYVGAAALACTAAGRSGAGLVTLATPESVYRLLAPRLTETTFLPLPEEEGMVSPAAACDIYQQAADYEALLIGCGLGQSAAVTEFLAQVLLSSQAPRNPTVLDADALNGLAGISQWWERLKAPAILTPHPGEFSRLTSRSTADIQSLRLETVQEAAQQWRQVVVLKGAYTVIATPEGRSSVSSFANPALASAGTGDVLAGVILGLLAQGLAPFDAAACGVYVHGAAGELVRREIGEAGLLAGDLLPQIPRAMNLLRQGRWPAQPPDQGSPDLT